MLCHRLPERPCACLSRRRPESVVYNTTVKDHIRNVQEPAFDAVVETQPDALYILFGTNTLVNGSEDTATKFITYYEKMIDMFHESLPNVPIYVQSIPGVQEWVKDSKPGLQNDRIKLVNNLLANMALRKGCYFVNIAEALNQPDGSQIDEYEADGIHMAAGRLYRLVQLSGNPYGMGSPQHLCGRKSALYPGQLMLPGPLCSINNISITNALPTPVLLRGKAVHFVLFA